MNTKPIGYCQGCQNFIQHHEQIRMSGRLLYHAWCVPQQPVTAMRPTTVKPARSGWDLAGKTLAVLCIIPAALTAGLIILLGCVACPPLALILILFAISVYGQRAHYRNLYWITRRGTKDGINDARWQR